MAEERSNVQVGRADRFGLVAGPTARPALSPDYLFPAGIGKPLRFRHCGTRYFPGGTFSAASRD